MYLDWWMFIVVAVVGWLYGEWRARSACSNVAKDITNQVAVTYEEMAMKLIEKEAKVQQQYGALMILIKLQKEKVIKIDDDGTVHGYNDMTFKTTMSEDEAIKQTEELFSRLRTNVKEKFPA